MFRNLGVEQDREGKEVVIAVLESPDPEKVKSYVEFLGHKGDIWTWQLEQLFGGATGKLISRIYAALDAKGKLQSAIMTAEAFSLGILGHVYTHPAHRRKGLCRLLFRFLLADFERRGGKALHLGTGYQSLAYRIYESVGFLPIGQTGFMRYAPNAETFYKRLYGPGPVSVRDATWEDYPVLSDLFLLEDADPIRLVAFGAIGVTCLEEKFLLMKRMALQFPESTQMKVLEKSGTNVAVGLATVFPDARWAHKSFILDVFVHPKFEAHCRELISALRFPKGKVLAYRLAAVSGKAAFEEQGFKIEGSLRAQLEFQGTERDVEILGRLTR